jgi:adenylate cyclase
LTETNLETFWQAELHRLQGELTLAQPSVQGLASSVKKNQRAKDKGQKAKSSGLHHLTPSTQAEACFHQAIDVARRQGAKALELRATMSLARLWQRQGKCGEAHQMLSPLYHRFTEGRDTKDLRDAETLLTMLS